jgi:hypothetical protein
MERFVSVVYCDDIRNEVGNKQSLIGIYRGDLYVPSFPATLPKLCVLVTVQTLANQPFESLKFRLLKDDTLLAEAPIPLESMPKAGSIDSGDGFSMFTLVLVMSPFKVDQPTKLRVRVDADGVELKAPALVIHQRPDATEKRP